LYAVLAAHDLPERERRTLIRKFKSDLVLYQRRITVCAIVLSLYLAVPFLSNLTWALVLAVVFARPHAIVERTLKNRSLAAGVSVLIIALIVVVPLLLVSERLIREAINGVNFVQVQIAGLEWRSFIDAHPWIERINSWLKDKSI
jgi:predicted PurR-regulated permease PerM